MLVAVANTCTPPSINRTHPMLRSVFFILAIHQATVFFSQDFLIAFFGDFLPALLRRKPSGRWIGYFCCIRIRNR